MALSRRINIAVSRQITAPPDESQSITVLQVGETLAHIADIRIACYQPDGTWKVFSWASGETPQALPGAGHLQFYGDVASGILVQNNGDVPGKLWCRLTDDTGTVLFEETSTVEVQPGEGYIFPYGGITFDMPNRDYTLTVEVGHV